MCINDQSYWHLNQVCIDCSKNTLIMFFCRIDNGGGGKSKASFTLDF